MPLLYTNILMKKASNKKHILPTDNYSSFNRKLAEWDSNSNCFCIPHDLDCNAIFIKLVSKVHYTTLQKAFQK